MGRTWSLAGDLLSLLGLGLMAFTLFTLWQEGPEALLVTFSPNRSAYQRRLGQAPLPELPTQMPARLLQTPPPSPPVTQAPESATRVPADAATPALSATSQPSSPQERSEHPVRIKIGKIDIDAPVVEAHAREVEQNGHRIIEWETPDYAVGHLAGTANLGEQGNIVLSGHNNIRGQIFRRLDRLVPGDEIDVFAASGERFRYIVREAVVVPEEGEPDAVRDENARYLLSTPDHRLTLISCWPYWTNTHRVIVVALSAAG